MSHLKLKVAATPYICGLCGESTLEPQVGMDEQRNDVLICEACFKMSILARDLEIYTDSDGRIFESSMIRWAQDGSAFTDDLPHMVGLQSQVSDFIGRLLSRHVLPLVTNQDLVEVLAFDYEAEVVGAVSYGTCDHPYDPDGVTVSLSRPISFDWGFSVNLTAKSGNLRFSLSLFIWPVVDGWEIKINSYAVTGFADPGDWQNIVTYVQDLLDGLSWSGNLL
jgi:hypothetical protein